MQADYQSATLSNYSDVDSVHLDINDILMEDDCSENIDDLQEDLLSQASNVLK